VALCVELERTRLHGLALDAGGRGPGLDVPLDLLAAVEAEGVKVEVADVRLVLAELLAGGGVVDLYGAVVAGRGGMGDGGGQQRGGRDGAGDEGAGEGRHGQSIFERWNGKMWRGRLSFQFRRRAVKRQNIPRAPCVTYRPNSPG
jgi:hypothetical protein